MISQDVIFEKLEDSGYRLTASRRKLLTYLFDHREGFTAEELVRENQEVGRATVYRTIRLLVEEGLLCKLALEVGAPRYALSHVAHHHHMVCVGCGAIREFRGNVIEKVLRGLDTAGGEVVGHRIEVYVLCADCRKRESPGPEAHVHNPADEQ